MSEAERQSFISGAELPAPTHTDNNHSDLLSELADTKRQLAQALAVNKQLYEFRVTQISSKPGKNSAVKLKSKTSNKSARWWVSCIHIYIYGCIISFVCVFIYKIAWCMYGVDAISQ